MAQATRPTTVRVSYSGYVQGVGFRFRTESLARRFAVAGYVRNLPDGRVELVAQGQPDEVERFLQRVREAMKANIRKEDRVKLDDAPPFTRFEIRY